MFLRSLCYLRHLRLSEYIRIPFQDDWALYLRWAAPDILIRNRARDWCIEQIRLLWEWGDPRGLRRYWHSGWVPEYDKRPKRYRELYFFGSVPAKYFLRRYRVTVLYQIDIYFVCDDEYMVFGYYFYKSVITHLEERTSYPEKSRNCLGLLFRLKGQKRLPIPPPMITQYLFSIVVSFF